MGLRYADVRDQVSAALTSLGYSNGNPINPDVSEVVRTMPVIDPGPFTVHSLWKVSPQGILFLTLGNGVGPVMEGLFDRPFITVRVVGKQQDFDYAETLAYDVDNILMSLPANHTWPHGGRTLFVNRTGGSPQLVDYDESNRYHFQTTYIAEAQR